MDYMTRKPLVGMTLDDLQLVVKSLGMPRFTAGQIAEWIYQKKVGDIEQMTNISKKNRALLSREYEVGVFPPSQGMRSVDGTVKYLFGHDSDEAVETVFIPDRERATLCVSSQVGCKMHCAFCMTGKQGFTKSLSACEILNQMISVPDGDKLTNVVFMGMGEPLDNFDNLKKVLEVMTSDWGFGWSPKRITVSTVGVRKGLLRFLDESDCHLAVSLHCPVPEQREGLMPAERAYSITDMVEDLKNYDFSHQRRLSFEYIVFKDMNDGPEYASILVKLLKGLDCRVNLIRYHAIPGDDFEGVDDEHMLKFRDYLTSHGCFATIRASRGEDIFAACGMLSTLEKEKKNN